MEAGRQVTYFAPAQREPIESVQKKSKVIENLIAVQSFFDSIPNIVMVLNQQRQLVFCNRPLLDLLGIGQIEPVLGSRPGELLGCIHATEMYGGCGTSESCRSCGAVLAILESQAGLKAYHECRLTTSTNGSTRSYDFGITASPLQVENEQYTIVFLNDISDYKRRIALERIFFHDILNTASSIKALAELLEDTNGPDKSDLLSTMQSAARQLVKEIQEQRDLLQAENNDLKVKLAPVYSVEILAEAAARFTNNEIFRRIKIQLEPSSENVKFISSPHLLGRVLGNMLKNALEASSTGETVRLGCFTRDGQVVFWVNNPAVMPREVQLQLFQRSFSTKGKNRGLGTYSMKLLSERYLQGSISFKVSEKEGTTFFAQYPLNLQDLQAKH